MELGCWMHKYGEKSSITNIEMHRVHDQNLITKPDQMETLGWITFFPFLKQPHVEMFMSKSRGEYHTYRHHLRGFSLMWYHPLKASYQQSQSNYLKALSSHYPSVSPRLLWARVRDGLHGPEFLISVLSIIKQGPSFPSCVLISGEKSTDPRTLSWPQ